jgi:hypothetical protein
MLFNIALEKVVREANLDIRGTKLHKFAQILAYDNDDVIVRRYKNAVKDAFHTTEMEVQDMCLMINYNKTKYMESGILILIIITTLHRKYTTELILQINAIVDSVIYWDQSHNRKIQNVKYIKN